VERRRVDQAGRAAGDMVVGLMARPSCSRRYRSAWSMRSAWCV